MMAEYITIMIINNKTPGTSKFLFLTRALLYSYALSL